MAERNPRRSGVREQVVVKCDKMTGTDKDVTSAMARLSLPRGSQRMKKENVEEAEAECTCYQYKVPVSKKPKNPEDDEDLQRLLSIQLFPSTKQSSVERQFGRCGRLVRSQSLLQPSPLICTCVYPYPMVPTCSFTQLEGEMPRSKSSLGFPLPGCSKSTAL